MFKFAKIWLKLTSCQCEDRHKAKFDFNGNFVGVSVVKQQFVDGCLFYRKIKDDFVLNMRKHRKSMCGNLS